MVEHQISMPHAIILAGGFGTRLQSRVSDRPKALAEVAGKPFLQYQLDWLIKQGVTDVSLATHYMADQLEEFVADWNDERLRICCVREQRPLGTGGAVANVIAEQSLGKKVLVLNGDTVFRFSLNAALDVFEMYQTPAMLVAQWRNDVSRYGEVIIENGYVKSFDQASGINRPGTVNGGAYLLNSNLFTAKEVKPLSLEKEIFPVLAAQGELCAYVVSEDEGFFDIGTPESYIEICSTGVSS